MIRRRMLSIGLPAGGEFAKDTFKAALLMSVTAMLLLVAIPGFVMSRMPGFELRWLWYLSVAAVTLQALLNLWLLRREFRLRLTPMMESAAPTAAAAAVHL